MSGRLAGRVAVVTGATGVLMRPMVEEMVRQGAAVAILNRTAQKGQEMADALRAQGGQVLAIPVDVLNRQQMVDARTQIMEQWGRCDILINGAGGNRADAITSETVFSPHSEKPEGAQSFFDLSLDGFQEVFNINFIGSVLASQVFGERLAASARGVVINISSMSALRPMTRVPAYSAAKAAIENFTKWLAVYLAEVGVRVNAIAPGFFLTEQNRRLLTNEDGSWTPRTQAILQHTPAKRLGTPDDLLGTLLWLLDDRASGFVTGITVPVDGGFLAYAGV
ncbi:MAG: D-mannonate oxidoreductase [Sulfobacillus thermosulfidooxidans]|nr:MAG: D-mannonate oxidoreductase [Sulfobacillus thermosulfidooxidans]